MLAPLFHARVGAVFLVFLFFDGLTLEFCFSPAWAAFRIFFQENKLSDLSPIRYSFERLASDHPLLVSLHPPKSLL